MWEPLKHQCQKKMLPNFTSQFSCCAILYLLASLVFLVTSASLTTLEPHTTKKGTYARNCAADANCMPNAYCFHGRCVCNDGFYLLNEEKCLKVASAIDDYCEKDDQCQAPLGKHSYCKLENNQTIGKCSCNEDSHFAEGLCYKTAYVGNSCDGNANCLIRSKEVLAYCERSFCICPPAFHPVDSGRDCVKSADLDEPCEETDACIQLNTICIQGFCKCQNEYIANTNNTECLLVPKTYEDPCSEDGQCMRLDKLSQCSAEKKTCVCKPGNHERNGACWKTTQLLVSCNHTNECRGRKHIDYGKHCIEGVCQCKEGYSMEDLKFCIKMENDDIAAGIGNISTLHFLLISLNLLFGLNTAFSINI